MSGHNKWSKIKRQKEKTDGQKSKIFGKMVKLITTEAKKAGGNLKSPGLQNAIEKAKWLLADPKYGKFSWDFKNIPANQFGAALKIYKLATPQEKQILAPLMDDKWQKVSLEIEEKYQQEVNQVVGGN